MSGVACTGRLCRPAANERNGGKLDGMPGALTWWTCSATSRSLSRCDPSDTNDTPSGNDERINPAAASETTICPPCAHARKRAHRMMVEPT